MAQPKTIDYADLKPLTYIPPEGVVLRIDKHFDKVYVGRHGTLIHCEYGLLEKPALPEFMFKRAGAPYYSAYYSSGGVSGGGKFDWHVYGLGTVTGDEHRLRLTVGKASPTRGPKGCYDIPGCRRMTLRSSAATAVDGVLVHMLPKQRKREYLIELVDGRLVYVSGDEHAIDFLSHRLWIGTPGHMVHHDVLNFHRSKDGGTTFVRCDAFRLVSPSWLCGYKGTKDPYIELRDGSCVTGKHADAARYSVAESRATLSLLD